MSTMGSDDIVALADRLQPQLTDLKRSAVRALDDLESARLHASVRLRDKRDRARAASRARRRAMERASAAMLAVVVARSSTTAPETRSKLDGDVERLLGRADQAEEYASAALQFAWGSMEEASSAILEAMVARLDANTAVATARKIRNASPDDGFGLRAGAVEHSLKELGELAERSVVDRGRVP